MAYSTKKITELDAITSMDSTDLFAVVHEPSGSAVTKKITKDNALAEYVKYSSSGFDVATYGAVGDGTTDDTAYIQAAITAANAAGGGIVDFPIGTFKVTSSITLYSNITLRGVPRKSFIDLSSATATLIAFTVAGTAGSDIVLTGDVAEGATTLALATTGLADDDWIKIQADSVICSQNVYQGEIGKIDTVDSAIQVTLFNKLLDDYTTGNSATIHKLTFVSNIAVEGLDFLGPTDNTLSISAFEFDICRDIRITNCNFTRMHYYSVWFKDSTLCKVYDCGFYDAELSGLSYGVMCRSGSQDILVTGCQASNTRHMVTIGGSTSDYGLVRRVNVVGNTITQCRSGGLDSHSAGEDISFCNNTIMGSSAEDGITVQGINYNISNNLIVGCHRHGITVQPLATHAGGCVISGNVIRDVGQYGILVTQTNSTYGNLTAASIVGNTMENVGMDGSYGFISLKSTNADSLSNITISGNSMRLAGGHMILLQKVISSTITGNTLYSDTASKAGVRLVSGITDLVISNNTITFGSSTGTEGIQNLGGTDVEITGNRVVGGDVGLYQDHSATYSVIMGNNFRGCGTTITAGAGAGHIYQTAALDPYNQA